MKFQKTLAFLSLNLILLSGISATFAQITWSGNTSTNWVTPSNWVGGVLPADDDDIIIPGSRSNYPVLTINRTMKSLTIESGVTLTQTNGTLLVKGGKTTISGTYNQTGGTFLTDQTVTVTTGGLININGTFHLADDIAKNPSDHLVVNGTINQTNGTLKVKDLTVNTGASYTSNGTTLDVFGNFKNYSTINLNGGDITLKGSITNDVGGSLSIAGATVTSLGQDVVNKGSMSISSGSLLLKKADGTSVDKKIQIDGGTFTQTGGTVSVKDLEIKNGGSYNQSGGEIQISHDLKIPTGTTFAATGGTVRFTGVAGGGADYRGNVQFYDVLIDDGADPKFNNDGDHVTIKIAGDFTNNNANMAKVDKSTFIFNGTGAQTIYSAIVPTAPDYEEATFGTLIVDKPSGALTLLSDISVDDTFTPQQGYLDLDGNILYVNGAVYEGPLPVELSSFSVVTLENGIKLKWRTETEVSNYGFEIERALSYSQNLIWENIGFVEGHGNSNSPKEYSYVDENVIAGKYSYRLKQIDTDGKFEFSKVIEVDLGSPMNYELSQNYPNPFNPSTTIRFSLLASNPVNLSIFNSLGEKVDELVNEVKEPGVHTLEFSAQDLPSGTYFYRIQVNGFTQIKKMILLK